MSLPGEVEVDIESNHVSQEEVIHTEFYVNQKDPNVQEKMMESTTYCQKCSEALGVKSVNTENDLGILTSATECTRDLNGAFLEERTSGELDITNGLKNLSLNAAIHPDEINIEIMNDNHFPVAKVYEVMNEDPETAFCTLANREAFSTEECSVQHCLYQFARNEKLQDANKLLCEVCTRCQGNGPKENTKDLAPFCTLKCKNVAEDSKRVLYSLYGVVERSGTMRSGHYTAYAKARTASSHLSNLVLHGDIPQDCEMESTKGQWFHINDTHVQAVPVAKVLNSQAYLRFYERIL
ncbi:ubiquitin carboxyl-terminal hydrolase 16 isoform X1 [Sigmodon hispidus]